VLLKQQLVIIPEKDTKLKVFYRLQRKNLFVELETVSEELINILNFIRTRSHVERIYTKTLRNE
jgi:hypothetical protein